MCAIPTIYLFREKKGRMLVFKSALGIVFVVSLYPFSTPQSLIESSYLVPNEPIGDAHGTFPGRVVWIHNPVKLSVYNFKGQLVFNTIVNNIFTWKGNTNNGSELKKGIYLVKLSDMKSGRTVASEKIVYQP